MKTAADIRDRLATHVVELPRQCVAHVCRRFWERSTMAATVRAAREFDCHYTFLRALLSGDRPVITIRQSYGWFRNVCRLSGDVDLAFEIGRQLQGGGD